MCLFVLVELGSCLLWLLQLHFLYKAHLHKLASKRTLLSNVKGFVNTDAAAGQPRSDFANS